MKKIIFTVIMICLFIAPVRAYELSLTGSDIIEKTESYILTIDSLGEYSEFYGLTATLNYDKDKLELVEITGDNNFSLTYSAKTNKLVLYNTVGIKDKTNIINMKFKNIGLSNDEKIKINITGITASDGNKDIKVKDISKEIKAIKEGSVSDNDLSSIKINGKTLDLEDGNINYEIVVGNDIHEITIDAVANNKNADVIGNDVYKLEEGSNEIKITVIDGEDEKTYTINVNRESNDANIDEDDLFIGGKKKRWNNIYFIPIGVLLGLIITLIIRRKGVK